MTDRLIRTAICSLLLILGAISVQAQDRQAERYSFVFRGEALSDVLEKIADKTETDMVYDPVLVEGISVYTQIKNQPVSELLRDVLAATSLDFITLSSGTIVIVRKVSEDPSYGSYSGKIVDRSTGEPLPGATVRLTNASGGTAAGPSGQFTLNNLVSGTYHIIFSYVGYEAVSKTITIKPNRPLREEVALTPSPIDFMPIIVTGHQPQVPNQGGGSPSSEPISRWETGKTGDAIRSLTLFPGVQYGLPMSDLHLQGGQQGEHRIMLDGVPVYNPHSFGQMFSAFSPYAISRVQLHKAGYGVSRGSQIAGLINLNHDAGSVDNHQLTLQGDPLSLNLRGDLYFPDGDDSSLKVMAAGRSNYWDLYREPTLDNTLRRWDELDPLVTNLLVDNESDATLYQPREHLSDVRFYDLHLAADYEIDPYKTLSSSFYLGENEVGTELLRQWPESGDAPEYLYARDAYRWENFMGQLSYSQLISSRLDLNSRLSFSSSQFRHRYLLGTSHTPFIPGPDNGSSAAVLDNFQAASALDLVPDQTNTNNIQHLIFRTDGTYSFTPKFNIKAGLQLDYVKSQLNFSDLFYLPTLSDQQSAFFSNYIKGNLLAGRYWKVSLGNRLTYASSSSQLYMEPRGSIQFDRTDAAIGYWSARIAGGLYRQFINQFEITNPGPTSLVPSFTVWSHAGKSETPKAWHISGSFHLEPAEHTALNFEVFYKWQPKTYTVSYRNLLQGSTINRSTINAFAETTTMKNAGAGIRVHQEVAQSKLKLMLGYDYSYNRINMDTQFGRSLPASWNEPHHLQLRTLWKIAPEWSAVAKWQSIWGRAWGFRQAYYNYLLFEGRDRFGRFSFTHPEKDRLDPFHQLDLSLIYEPSFEFMDLELRMDLINLLDRRNTIDWRLQPRQTASGEESQYEIKKRSLPGFNPSVSIQVDF